MPTLVPTLTIDGSGGLIVPDALVRCGAKAKPPTPPCWLAYAQNKAANEWVAGDLVGFQATLCADCCAALGLPAPAPAAQPASDLSGQTGGGS